MSGSAERRELRHPLDDLGALPSLTGPVLFDHLPGGWNANPVEVKHLDIIDITLRDCARDRRLSRPRGTYQNDKLHTFLVRALV